MSSRQSMSGRYGTLFCALFIWKLFLLIYITNKNIGFYLFFSSMETEIQFESIIFEILF